MPVKTRSGALIGLMPLSMPGESPEMAALMKRKRSSHFAIPPVSGNICRTVLNTDGHIKSFSRLASKTEKPVKPAKTRKTVARQISPTQHCVAI
jgi:hypothetical protein